MDDGVAFTCHRAIAPMMWVAVTLSLVELVVVHALLAVWWPRVATVLSLASVTAIGWLVWAIGTLRSRPSVVAHDAALLRAGAIKRVTVPIAAIDSLHPGGWTDAEVKARATLNLALIAWPNVVVRLREPIMLGRRRIDAIAHRLDDPDGFAAALERVRAADD